MEIAIGVGKVLVGKIIKALINRVKKINANLSEEFKIRGRDMRICCPDSIQTYSVSFESKGVPFFTKKRKFKFGKVRRVSLRSVQALQTISKAIDIVEDGFEINLKFLQPGELYILDIEYLIDDPNFIDSLVYRKVTRDIPKEKKKEYWMTAQLKHLDVLKQDFGFIELRDLDLNVNVGVHQDISLKIPGAFKKQLETVSKLLKPIGRGMTFELYSRLLHQQKSKFGGKEYEILRNLQDLFVPYEFKRYLDVKYDFTYSNCFRGTEYYDLLPFPTWPKFMNIISRTDLNFDKPAANGLLIFKRKDFIVDIAKIFE